MTQLHPLVIHYSTTQSDIGVILLATLKQQIYSVILDDSEEACLATLTIQTAKDFPRAKLQATSPHTTLSLISNFIAAPSHQRYQSLQRIDLYCQGTDFQQRVWQALSRIPLGQTVSYATLAQQLGCPKAVRAVAQACAANRHAIIIPCHRVLRSDGSISGYRWGVARKQQLLALEATTKEAT